jgi:hypothetical protein
MGDDHERDRQDEVRMRRRLPWQGAAGLLLLLAVGVLAGGGLRAWVIVVPMVLLAIGALLWSLRL